MSDAAAAEEKRSWLARLKAGLSRSTQRVGESIGNLFTKRRLDKALLAELEDALIAADLGPATAERLTQSLAKSSFDKDVDVAEVKRAFAAEIAQVLRPVAQPFAVGPERPHVVLVVGVNGSGKTTTIGKLAKLERDRGRKVILAACDTFRAAAVQQLKIWGERASVEVVARDGADASGLAFEALERAKKENADVLFVDTAGRLQNKKDLMAEVQKIIRVLRKIDPAAPHQCLLVLDATTGQNAHSQVDVFKEMCDVTGLIVTKLDGSAKGGVVVALADRFKLPVVAIGVGETTEDLRPFDAESYADSLMGLP